MATTLRIDKAVEFPGLPRPRALGDVRTGSSGGHGHEANIQGKMNQALVTFVDDFLGDTLQDEWQTAGDGGGAIVAGANGIVNVSVPSDASNDDERQELAHNLNWYARQAVSIEFRAKINDITTVGVCMGFADAVAQANDKLPIEMLGDDDTTDNATDAVAFVFDTDALTDKWHCCATSGGTGATPVAATGKSAAQSVPVNATYQVFRIDLDELGNAKFWMNDATAGGDRVGGMQQVGYIATAVNTSNALTPYFGVIARGVSKARELHVDYVKCWQNRLESSTVKH